MNSSVEFKSDHGLPLLPSTSGQHNLQVESKLPQPVRRKPVPSRLGRPNHVPPDQNQQIEYAVLSTCNDETGDSSTKSSESDQVQTTATAKGADSASDEGEDALWLPYGLKAFVLIAIVVLALLILLAVIVMHWRSASNSGLGADGGSSSIYFAWHFVPTLVAVAYVTLLMMILEDIKRTETFARLATSGGSSARATILRSPEPWWTTLVDSFPRKRNQFRLSLTMLVAVTAYILGFTIISPFSSSLLVSQDVSIKQSAVFKNAQLPTSSSLQLELDTIVYYQSIGHTLQNVTTSAWISDQYLVAPFWPSSSENAPTGALLGTNVGSWKAETTVFQSELSCEKMELTANALANLTSQSWNWNRTESNTKHTLLQTLRLSTVSGCEYSFAYYNDTFSLHNVYDLPSSGTFWSNLTTNSAVNLSSAIGYIPSAIFTDYSSILLNYSSQCEPGEVIVNIEGTEYLETPRVTGLLCRPTYYIGKLPVTLSTNAEATVFDFDENVFLNVRVMLADDKINITNFQQAFLSPDWNAYMYPPRSNRSVAAGPAVLLGALHNFNISNLAADSELADQARRIKQRVFGQALLQSLLNAGNGTEVVGEISTPQRRIVVVEVVAYIIEVVLALQILLVLVTFATSRLNRRPLGLSQDPAFVNTITASTSGTDSVRDQLRSMANTGPKQLEFVLAQQNFTMSRGNLIAGPMQPNGVRYDHDSLAQPDKVAESSRQPAVMSTWASLSLAVFLGAVFVTIMVLYVLSSSHGLYQSAFIYQASITVGGDTIGTLAPYSIIPTLIAVIIGLWWGALEGTFRVAQPFIAMAKSATPSGRGSGLSYQSSYLAWAASRALYRRHWLLALVCIGASLAQIFTIAMSALWQRQPGYLNSTLTAEQALQLRQIPILRTAEWIPSSNYGYKYIGDVVADVFQDLTTNWLYGAAIQLTLGGTQPAWSQDGWSFVPVEIPPGLSESASNSTHMSLITPAIRGQLECSPIAYGTDWKDWLTRYDLTNDTIWNTTSNPKTFDTGYGFGYELNSAPVPTNFERLNLQPNGSNLKGPCSLSGEQCYYSNFLASGASATCCSQGSSEDPGISYFGHWSFNSDSSVVGYLKNFTVKWIRGRASNAYQQTISTGDNLVWVGIDPPEIMALDCLPVIEAANASVAVDVESGLVQSYKIMDPPQPHDFAWMDNFLEHLNESDEGGGPMNVTVSYGNMFMRALLGAADIPNIWGCTNGGCSPETMLDRTFNIRQPGYNLDYMSYAMLSLTGNNSDALLDPNVLISLANQTFATFFQHFASSNVSADGTGSWVYQRVNETLPSDLGYVAENTTTRAPSSSSDRTNATQEVIITRQVEMLQMSPAAVWICLVILVWLIVTLILVIILRKSYFAPLLRPVNTVADVAIMVAGSDAYLEKAREQGATGLRESKGFLTRLGWFKTQKGEVRWGIEVVDGSVEFITQKQAEYELAKQHDERQMDVST